MNAVIRIGYMSDLHLEFEERGPDHPTGAWFALQKARRALSEDGHPSVGPLLADMRGEIDLMVIAGDTQTARGRKKGRSAIHHADLVAQYLGIPVVAVAGNHEPYDGDLEEEIRELRKEAAETEGRVTFLEQEETAFDLPGGRLHILGCTLWTDFALFGDAEEAMNLAAEGMNDFRGVRYRGETFTPAAAREIHRQSKAWIGESVATIREEEPDALILVVTHHAPSIRSVPQNRLNDPLITAYASNLEAEIAAWQPSAWIHGHLHGECVYDVSGVSLRSAARGYIGYEAGAEMFKPCSLGIG